MNEHRTILDLAQKGEIHRSEGNHSEAIHLFVEAMARLAAVETRNDRLMAWLHAHCGAAKGAMGFLYTPEEEEHIICKDGEEPEHHPIGYEPGKKIYERVSAYRHFREALWLARGRREDCDCEYPWAYAQLGEAYRVYVRNNLSRLGILQCACGPGDKAGKPTRYEPLLVRLLEKGREAFEKAHVQRPRDAWVLAHRGALEVLGSWILRDESGEPLAQAPDYGAMACRDFESACELNRVYSWAMAFHAFQKALDRDFDRARALLGNALAVDSRRDLDILKPLAKLFNYGRRPQESLDSAWALLQQDPFDATGHYLVAVSLAKLKSPMTKAAIEMARNELRNWRSMATAQLGALALLEGDEEEARASLREVARHRDLETVSFVAMESTWDPLRGTPEYRALFPRSCK